MPSRNTLLMAAAAALFTTSNAHMILKTPAPYGTPNSSPLAADGSDFPCKQPATGFAPPASQNIMPIGVNQTLSFTGSAVHGGGSCQVSLTTDQKPTKSSQWQVIHSIEGGCPASAPGNLPEDPNGNGASKFDFSIPEGISPGQYTLAWTWFNRIGNREMYMNCAPVTVTGASKRDVPGSESKALGVSKRDTSFPAMFVANIGNGCTTADSQDLKFPDPGNSVQLAGSNPLVPPVGNCAAGSSSAGSSGSSGSSGSAGPSPSGASPSPSASTAAPASSPSSSGGVFQQGSSSAPGAAPSGTDGIFQVGGTNAPAAPTATILTTAAPSAASTPTAAPANSSSGSGASAPSSSSGSGTSTPGSSSCSTPGQEMCSPDGTQIGMCDETSHIVYQPVAAGTTCSNGLMIAAPSGHKRSAPGHIRRNHPRAFGVENW